MGYRENIMNNVRTDRRHPVNKGVKMQAHHLMSKKGVRLSGLKADLEHLGYDIDLKENLVLLPCTLKGACHLAVQLHRGNHTATAQIDILSGDDPANDDDNVHETSYHLMVSTLLRQIRLKRNNGRLCRTREATIQREMDRLSERMLLAIQTFAIPLSSIHSSFQPLEPTGCCNQDSTGDARRLLDAPGGAPDCVDNRDHQGDEGITHRGKPYLLTVGK